MRFEKAHLAINERDAGPRECAFEALLSRIILSAMLGQYQRKVESSWIKEELWRVRNFHQGSTWLLRGMFTPGCNRSLGERGVRDRYTATPGHTHMKKLSQIPPDGGDEVHLIGRAKGDGKLTFDKLTDLYHSGTKHEETSPHTWSFITPTSAMSAASWSMAARARVFAPPTSTKCWTIAPRLREAHQL